MRILCALHAHLALAAAQQRFPELRGEPVIVGGAPELRLPVIAASPAAQAAGVRPGQPLRQAQQLCPAAAFVAADPAAVARLRAAMCRSLHRHAPAVEVGDDEAFCDVSGRHALHGDEGAWAAAIARAIDAVLEAGPAVGVAGTRFVARMAARCGRPGRIRRVRPGDEPSFLAPLPLDALPIDPAVAARLAGFGLDSLGSVAMLSPAELLRQFGSDGARLHRLVRGEDADGVHPEPAARTWSERLVLDGPVGDLEVLLRAARRCSETLGARLVARGLAAAAATVVYEMEEGEPILAAETASPVASTAELWTVVLGLLARLRPTGPVTAVRVEAATLEAAGGRQADLLRPGDAARDTVALAAGRLRTRFGEETVRRPQLALDPGDLPERRYAWTDAPAVGMAS